MGYFIQRPEAHCVHHRLGFHYHNFADLSVWDMLFGTFRNPREFHGGYGFGAGADRKMGAMLAFDDVNAAQYGPGSFGVGPPRRRPEPDDRRLTDRGHRPHLHLSFETFSAPGSTCP
jgi:hypothetical protein